MYVCKGKIVGMNEYVKDGIKKRYAQITYESKVKGFSGLRCASCLASDAVKIGDSVKVADDFRYPQIIEE